MSTFRLPMLQNRCLMLQNQQLMLQHRLFRYQHHPHSFCYFEKNGTMQVPPLPTGSSPALSTNCYAACDKEILPLDIGGSQDAVLAEKPGIKQTTFHGQGDDTFHIIHIRIVKAVRQFIVNSSLAEI